MRSCCEAVMELKMWKLAPFWLNLEINQYKDNQFNNLKQAMIDFGGMEITQTIETLKAHETRTKLSQTLGKGMTPENQFRIRE